MTAPTSTLTLADFLLARLDEDEAAAQAATSGPWHWLDEADSGNAENVLRSTTDITRWGEERDVLRGWGGYADREGIEASDADKSHIARHDPARVLADVAAKRAIVAQWRYAMSDRDDGDEYSEGTAAGAEAALEEACQYLAEIYDDHPDYRAEWRVADWLRSPVIRLN